MIEHAHNDYWWKNYIVQKLNPNLKRSNKNGRQEIFFPSVKPNMSQFFYLLVCMHENVKAINLRLLKQGKVTLNSVCRLGCATWELCMGKTNTPLPSPLCFMLSFILTAAHVHTHTHPISYKFGGFVKFRNHGKKYI